MNFCKIIAGALEYFAILFVILHAERNKKERTMDYLSIINKYYPEEENSEQESSALRQLLLKHSRQVADRCLLIAKKHKELPVDIQFY